MKISRSVITGFSLGMFLFVYTNTFAKEKKGVTVSEEYYLVQEYVGNTALGNSEPRKLYCQGKKCSLFLGTNQKYNFFSNKLCKKTYPDDIVSKYSCSDKNVIYRVMKINKEKHDETLMLYLFFPKKVDLKQSA